MATSRLLFKNCRLSYAKLAKPDPETGKYSVTLLIPKNEENKKKIMLGVQEAAAAGADRFGSKFPTKPRSSVHDGDGQRADGNDFGDECKGCYVVTASTKRAPQFLDSHKKHVEDPIEIEEEFYSGCYAHVSATFFPYDTGVNKGVGLALNNLMKARDGERLGGAFASADEDFADIEADEDEDEDEFADLL